MKNFWCEVYLDKLYNNLKIIREIADDKKIIAVVKGNAYGLGIQDISKAIEDKVDYYAVADIEEAKLLKTEKEILLLSPLISKEDFSTDLKNIIFTIDNKEIINDIPEELEAKVHIYVDTGMNRMGVKGEELGDVISQIENKLPNVKIEGVYTHLHHTSNVKYTLKQIEKFKSYIEPYKNKFKMIHCLNSSGFINDEIRTACDFTNAVRAGNIIYGYDGMGKGLIRIYNYYSKPVNVCEVKKGETVGYGCLFKAKKTMKIGILGFGNIEHFGFSKDLRKNIFIDMLKAAYNSIKFRPVIFAGNRGVRVLGRSNMNITIVDMAGISKDELLRVEISPILADSRIKKIYYNENREEVFFDNDISTENDI